MKTGFKIFLGVTGALAVAGVCYVGYAKSSYSRPRLVSKTSDKKMTLKVNGKNVVIDVQKMSDTGLSTPLTNKWSVIPAYGNISDKKNTLAGLSLVNMKGVSYDNWYF
jgi:hypothetical protein